MSAGTAARPARSRLADFALLVLTALTAAIALLGVGLALGADAFLRWGGLAAFSAVFFGVGLRISEYKRTRRFRIFFALFVAAHFALWVIILRGSPTWRLFWFAPMIFEVPIYTRIYVRLFPDAWARSRQPTPNRRQGGE